MTRLSCTCQPAAASVLAMEFERMSAVGEFSDLAAARLAAARDLPPGVLVRHSGGGFVVGHEDVELASGELLPAYVLWPDGEERLVEAREQLAGALRERLDWLCDRAREMALDDVERGRETALGAIDALDLGGELTNQALGPGFHAGCSA